MSRYVDGPAKPLKHEQNQGDGPPDLDELLKKWKSKLFGTSKKSNQGDGDSSETIGKTGVVLIILAIVAIWAISGIYIVSPAESAAVLRFGQYQETVGPGPHWIPRGIESKYVVNVQKIHSYSYNAEMLTKDENIVSVAISVQYRVDNIRDYLFNIVTPVASLEQATASALRQVVGHTKLDDILTTGREQVREQVAVQLRELMQQYQSGLAITDVTLQPAKPPEQVTAAFDDAIKAREDEQTYINKANAYSRKVSAEAQGNIARIMQQADAYRQEVILQAQGQTVKFLALLPEYKKAPAVTRERLYLNMYESVLANTSKVLVDVKGGNNIMYLPLDQIIKKQFTTDQAKQTVTTSDRTSTTDLDNYALRPVRPVYPTGGY